MKLRKRKWIFIIIVLILILIIGIFWSVTSNRIAQIPLMSFDEMMAYTTKNSDHAIITVGTIKNGEMSYTVYGNNASTLPNEEYIYEIYPVFNITLVKNIKGKRAGMTFDTKRVTVFFIILKLDLLQRSRNSIIEINNDFFNIFFISNT